MEGGFSAETDSRSSIQSILGLLWHLKFIYRAHKIQPRDSTLDQMIPVHTLAHYSCKI